SSTNSFLYTGRENDGTGLIFLRARYYNSQIGRFISEDPAGFAGSGPNLYGYVYDNPLGFRDPYGFAVCDQTCLDQIDVLEKKFPGSSFNNGVLTIPQTPDAVAQALSSDGYHDPGQWWNVFLYWDIFAHSGGDEYRLPVGNGSFHFRKP